MGNTKTAAALDHATKAERLEEKTLRLALARREGVPAELQAALVDLFNEADALLNLHEREARCGTTPKGATWTPRSSPPG